MLGIYAIPNFVRSIRQSHFQMFKMVTLQKVKKHLAENPLSANGKLVRLVRLKEAWVEGRGWIQMPTPLASGVHFESDICQMVKTAIDFGATKLGFEIKYPEYHHPATADFSVNEVLA